MIEKATSILINTERNHDSLGGMTPLEALENAGFSTFEPST